MPLPTASSSATSDSRETVMPGRWHHHDMTFDVDDGGPRDGVPVVLLHGFPANARSWHRVAPMLHDAGVRTLAPDQRGYSPRARPRHRRDYVLAKLVGDIVALLDEFGIDSAHVVGHDWGGTVAWAMAATVPSRVTTLTVLSTPHPAAFVQALWSSSQAVKSWHMLAAQLPVVPEWSLRCGLERSLRRSGLSADVAGEYVERLSEPGALTAALHWYRALPWSLGSPVGRVRLPTTYVWGRDDPFLGRTAATRSAAFVAADYDFVELDAGHWLPEEHAAAVVDCVLARITGPVN